MKNGERLGAMRSKSRDTKFMKEVGIEPCNLEKPFQSSLPLPDQDPQAHNISEVDVSWLRKHGILWAPDPPFVPPMNLQQYLSRYPKGIRDGVEDLAKELKTGMARGEIDDLARQISELFVRFALTAEDIVETYSHSCPSDAGKDTSVHFHEYFYLCIRAAMLTLLGV